ncbi:histone-lysine N-methyltransferase SETMAR [Trichonephila clavipes]|nr:histone-lysine N-methyltransferase SETMAR [Trichonephila clavipes]
MESDEQFFRHILLFYYRKGKNAVQARKKLTDVYGEDVPRSGRPVEADKDAIKALVEANRRITTREIGLRLNISNSTVYGHLKGPGLSSKLDVWVPHVLTERNVCRHIDICDSLLKRHENDPFLKCIITGDEKGHGAKKMNQLKPFRKSIFTQKREGRESVEDGNCSGRLQASRTAEIIKKVSIALRKNMIQTIAESFGISSATCQWILTKHLNVHRVCQYFVTFTLKEDQFADEVKNSSQVELKDLTKKGFQKRFDDFYKPWLKCVVI